MSIRGKHIDNIDADDIKALIDNQVSESLILEYKRDLPGKSDKDVKEFLADISSFANKNGGDIIYGIEEKRDKNDKNTALPGNIYGLGEINTDEEMQRIQSIISTGLDPKLVNIEIKDIQISEQTILILRIPRSLFAPHMIAYKKSGKFYVRNNSGKDQMNADELRQSFLLAESWQRQADTFKQHRISQIMDADLIPNLDLSFPYIIHILPLGDRTNHDLKDFQTDINFIVPNIILQNFSGKKAYNYDGFMMSFGQQQCHYYVQAFRNGGIELYMTAPTIRENLLDFDNKTRRDVNLLDGQQVELFAIEALHGYKSFAVNHNITIPVILYISILEVKYMYICIGYGKTGSLDMDHINERHIDRDKIFLPGIVISDLNYDSSKLLEQSFDILWQAGGWPESPWNKARRQKRQKENTA